jgi:predicted membrane metal-binding protein
VRRFIEQRQPHEGLVHALLVSGSIGTFFFATFCFAILIATWRSVGSTPPMQISPIQTWCSALLFTLTIAFYLLGGDYTNFLIQVCPVTALLYRAEALRRAALKDLPPLTPTPTFYQSEALSAQS